MGAFKFDRILLTHFGFLPLTKIMRGRLKRADQTVRLSYVRRKSSLLCEFQLAESAGVWPFPRMLQLMHRQVIHFGETHLTNLTSKRLLTCVSPYMTLQVTIQSKPHITNLTLKRLIPVVTPHMDFQFITIDKAFSA